MGVNMSQEVKLNDKWGYRLCTNISIISSGILRIETEIENKGSESFSTPRYSHNFLSVDRRDIGPPWRMSLVPDVNSREETGVGVWSQPLSDYFSASGDEISAKKTIPD